MRGFNKVMILGHAGAQPESKSLKNGSSITNLTVATSESRRDGNGQFINYTEWHNVVFFNQLADIALKYINKGSKVFIEGSIRTSKWKDNNGADRNKTEIIAFNLILLDAKEGGHDEMGNKQNQYGHDERQYRHTGKVQWDNRDDDDGMPY